MSKIFIHEEKKRAWKIWKTTQSEVAWDRNILPQADTITSLPSSTDKDMERKSISKIKNGKAVELSGLVSETVKTAEEAGVEKT